MEKANKCILAMTLIDEQTRVMMGMNNGKYHVGIQDVPIGSNVGESHSLNDNTHVTFLDNDEWEILFDCKSKHNAYATYTRVVCDVILQRGDQIMELAQSVEDNGIPTN